MSEYKIVFNLKNHIIGKAYDLTQKNMNLMIEEIEKLQAENARYREALQVYADDDVIGAVARKALKG